MSVKEEFIKECITNREYLGFSYEDMANCLIDVSVNEYKDFESGKGNMSKENVSRLIRVLCIEKPKSTSLALEFDEDSTIDEKEDLLNIASLIEGDLDD